MTRLPQLTGNEAEPRSPKLLEEDNLLALVAASQQDADRAGLQALAQVRPVAVSLRVLVPARRKRGLVMRLERRLYYIACLVTLVTFNYPFRAWWYSFHTSEKVMFNAQ